MITTYNTTLSGIDVSNLQVDICNNEIVITIISDVNNVSSVEESLGVGNPTNSTNIANDILSTIDELTDDDVSSLTVSTTPSNSSSVIVVPPEPEPEPEPETSILEYVLTPSLSIGSLTDASKNVYIDAYKSSIAGELENVVEENIDITVNDDGVITVHIETGENVSSINNQLLLKQDTLKQTGEHNIEQIMDVSSGTVTSLITSPAVHEPEPEPRTRTGA